MVYYHYLAASLPFLTGPLIIPPMDSAGFLEDCQRLMKPVDFQDILATNIDPESNGGGGLARKFGIWEGSLRNELIRLRAGKTGRNPDESTREVENEAGMAAVAAQAMAQPNPLITETTLDRCRWNKIDELSTGHFFDMEYLRAYRLKLQILERNAMFSVEKGVEVYNVICKQILKKAEDGV